MGERYEDGLGGSIEILERGGQDAPMRFRMVLPKGFGPPAPECHPRQSEDFRVLRGTLDLGQVDGRHVSLEAGDTFTLPAGVFHLPANRTEDELEMECTLSPGLDSAEMFAELYAQHAHAGLAQAVRHAQVFRRYPQTISFPAHVRWGMALAASLGRLFGVKPDPAPGPSMTQERPAAVAAP